MADLPAIKGEKLPVLLHNKMGANWETFTCNAKGRPLYVVAHVSKKDVEYTFNEATKEITLKEGVVWDARDVKGAMGLKSLGFFEDK